MAGTCHQLTFCYFVSLWFAGTIKRCCRNSVPIFQCFRYSLPQDTCRFSGSLIGHHCHSWQFPSPPDEISFLCLNHFYIPNDKNWTVDVKFYHLLQTVAHKQLTTEDCSVSPWNSQIFPIFKMITLHNF